MAIISVNLVRGSRTSDFSKEGGTAVREYQVISDGNDNELTIPLAIGLPTYGTPHPTNGSFTCKTLSVREVDPESKKLWVATATFDQQPLDNKNENNPTRNPLLERGTFRIASSGREEQMEEDADGNAILTTANEPIRGVTKEVNDFTMIVTKNLATLPFAALAAAAKQATNSAIFFDAAIGTARLSRIDGDLLWHPTCGDYFATTWEFAVRDGGWDKEVLNEGFFELNDENPAEQVIIALPAFDSDGNRVSDVPVAEPHLLTVAGKRLPQDGTPNYITVKRYNQTDFGSLGVPTSIAEL